MSNRFKGWRNYNNDITNKHNYVSKISAALIMLGVEHELEYKFLLDRKFRFDIAIPNLKIAIEFEGGIWINGRHTRGKGYATDTEKYNLAVLHGWKVLRYTTYQTKEQNWEFKIALDVNNLIEMQKLLHPKV